MKINTLGIIIICILLILAFFFSTTTITFKLDGFKQVYLIVGYMFVTALFMERSIEVFLSAWRSKDADIQDLAITAKTNALNKSIAIDPASDDVTTLTLELETLNNKRTIYRTESRGYALWAGLIFGIIIAFIGFRVLEGFVDPDSLSSIKNSYHEKIFKIVDIVLTGGVIAGGSEGINKLTKVYTSFMQSTAKKMGENKN